MTQTRTVYIMVGASGSGKSTWIKNNVPNALVCSADHFFYNKDGVYNFNPTLLGVAHGDCASKFNNANHNGVAQIVVDNTNTRLKEIRPYVRLAKEYGANVVFVRFNVAPDVCATRNSHGVPSEAVQGMYDRCMALELPPEWGEQIWVS